MHVARYAVGGKAVGKHRARGLERERSHAMADVENDAAVARLDDGDAHPVLRRRRIVGKWAEAMGENVAWAKANEHVLKGRRGNVDVRHEREARFFGDLERDVERRYSRVLRRIEADPDLDPRDRVAVCAR